MQQVQCSFSQASRKCDLDGIPKYVIIILQFNNISLGN